MSKFKIQRYKTSPVLAFASDDNQIITTAVDLNGRLRRVVFVVPALDGTDTADITIKDVDGYTVYSKTTVAKSSSSNETGLDIALSGRHTITIDTSGGQTANRTFAVVLLIDRG